MLVSRRHFFFGSLALPALAARKPAPERPNIVLLLVDRLPAWMLACYGNKEVRSPNIQRLSDTGTRFLNHFAASSIGAQNRATLLSGRTPMQTGEGTTPPTSGGALEKTLSAAGYATEALGGMSAAELTIAAQKFLEAQAPAKPFSLTVTFSDLLAPTAPAKFLDLYAGERFASYALDPVAPTARSGKEQLLNRIASLRQVAASIGAIDEAIGAITSAIAKKQLLDATAVILASTCGALYGRHGLWSDGQASDPVNMFDEVVRTPLIWSWPHRLPPGGEVIEMTSACDLAPAVCDLLTLALPEGKLSGRSYLPVAELKILPKKQPWRKIVCAHSGTTEMAREEDYKVVIRDGGKGPNELYDLTRDPVEKTNVYESPEYLDVKNRLTAELTRWKQNYSA